MYNDKVKQTIYKQREANKDKYNELMKDHNKKYYEENKESIKKKAREYSREKYYPQHREQKILTAKAYQEKKKGVLTEENIYFPKII